MGRRRTNSAKVSFSRALADLNVAFGETAEHKAARRAILARFARMANGSPVLCAPPMEEQRMGRISGAFKVIYDTEDNARDAARELSFLGSPPQAPYRTCPYGEPHWHLKTLSRYVDEKKRREQ